jgi:hypothetical protein
VKPSECIQIPENDYCLLLLSATSSIVLFSGLLISYHKNMYNRASITIAMVVLDNCYDPRSLTPES